MSGDLLFWLLSVVALAAALAPAWTADRLRSVRALGVTGLAVAGLFALLGAWLAAALLAASTAGGLLLSRGAAAGPGTGQATASARLRSAAVVVAFLVVVARALLMARWPLAAVTTTGPAAFAAVGLLHFLLAALVLFGAGWLAAMTQRRLSGIAAGAATGVVSAALAVAASGRFVGGAAEANLLAAVVVALVATAVFLAARFVPSWKDAIADDGVAEDAGGTLSLVLAAVALALLAGAW
ncbi:MAG: hypothetical protein ABR538_02870 [Candidatus Binatia bacterium]